MDVGFIGTGRMGYPMAMNLQKAGHRLVVHDIRPAAAEGLLERGATWADTPRAVAEQSEVVFGSLPRPADVEQVFLGENGLLEGMRPGQAYFDLTTSNPSTSRKLADIAAQRGVYFLDAPVSGGTQGAKDATLAVMVGGDRQIFERYRPLLEVIGKNVFYLGGVGNGNVAKLVNNMISFANRAIAAEGFILGVKAGVDPQLLFNCIRAGTGNSTTIANWDTTVFRGDFTPTFALELAAKDIGLAVDLARELTVPLRVAPIVQQLIIEALASGLGELNSTALIKPLERAAGVELRVAQGEV